MEKQEFTVTGPGEYRTRDGRKAIVETCAHEHSGLAAFPVAGTVDGSLKTWDRAGSYLGHGVTGLDLVGPWIEPATLDETAAIEATHELGLAGAGLHPAMGPPGTNSYRGAPIDAPAQTPGPMAFAVGQKWRTRGGDVVEIVSVSDPGEQPIKGIDKDIGAQFWNADGAYMHSGAASSMDLVELVSAAASDASPAFAAGQTWKTSDGREAKITRISETGAIIGTVKSLAGRTIEDSVWYANGVWASNGIGPHPLDLVEFVSHPAEPDEPLIDAAAAHLEGLRAGQVVDAEWVPPEFVEVASAAAAHLDWSTVPTVRLPVAEPDAEEEPTDYRECAEVLAAALRMLCDAVDASIPRGAHGLKLEDARRLATVALDGYAP